MTTRATLQTVAESLGLSVSAVSKSINGRRGPSQATRERVLEECGRLGYDLRRPPRRSSTAIEAIFDSLGSAISRELMMGLVEAVDPARNPLVVVSVDSENDVWVDDLLRRRPAGVILVVASLPSDIGDRLAEAGIVAAVVDLLGEAPDDLVVIGSTHWRGGYLAAEHLLMLGHRDIAMISGPAGLVCTTARVGGFQSALRAAGLEPRVLAGEFRADSGRRLAHRLLGESTHPTAIATGNDLQALGVIEAAYDLDLHVPRDLSIVGYDDLLVASMSTPALTTIHQPLREMAYESGLSVRRQLVGAKEKPLRMELNCELQLRHSTGPLT